MSNTDDRAKGAGCLCIRYNHWAAHETGCPLAHPEEPATAWPSTKTCPNCKGSCFEDGNTNQVTCRTCGGKGTVPATADYCGSCNKLECVCDKRAEFKAFADRVGAPEVSVLATMAEGGERVTMAAAWEEQYRATYKLYREAAEERDSLRVELSDAQTLLVQSETELSEARAKLADLEHQLGKAQGEAEGHRLVRVGLEAQLAARDGEREALLGALLEEAAAQEAIAAALSKEVADGIAIRQSAETKSARADVLRSCAAELRKLTAKPAQQAKWPRCVACGDDGSGSGCPVSEVAAFRAELVRALRVAAQWSNEPGFKRTADELEQGAGK